MFIHHIGAGMKKLKVVIDITAGQKVDRRHITNQHEKKGSPGGTGGRWYVIWSERSTLS